MVKISGLVLLLAILFQLFSKQIIFTGFLVNRSFIAHELCEKKKEKINTCQGKCRLKKDLEKDSERNENSRQNLTKAQEVLFTQDHQIHALHNFPANTFSHLPFIIKPLLKGNGMSVFHPPSC